MAEIRYPLGAPLAGKPFPGPDGPLDTELAQQESSIRRRRSPFEPPAELGIIPRIVPRNLYRAAQAEDIKTRAEALSVRHSALDLGFNADADSLREGLSGFRSAGDLLTVGARIEEMSRPNAQLVHDLSTTAIATMRRSSMSPQIWKPGPLPESDQPDGYMNHLASVTQRAAWGYRGTPSGGDGTTPIVVEKGWMERLKGVATKIIGIPGVVADVLPVREVAALGETLTNPGGAIVDHVLHRGESASRLTLAASAIGTGFDGKEFWRSVWVNGGAGIASGFGTVGDFEAYRIEAEQSFDRHWSELPRPAQLFAEELNPGNVALAWVGGPLSSVLKQSSVRAARVLGGLVAPLAENPLKAVGLAVASGMATRGGYEATEGAPTIVRLGAALAAGGGIVGAEQALERGLARMGTTGFRSTFDNELKQIVPDLPDNWTVAKPEAYELAHRTPTIQRNNAAFDGASTGAPLRVTGFREDSGPRLAGTGVFYGADPSTAANYRKGGAGHLLAEPLEFHNPLVTDSKQQLLEAFSRSPDEAVAARGKALLEAQVGENVPSADIDTFIATQAQAQGRDAVVYRAPTDTKGGYPFNASEVVDIRRDPILVNRELGEAREEVQSLQEAMRFQLSSDTSPDVIAETRNELRFALREEGRLAAEAREGPGAVGYARATDLPLPLRSAMGDGGVIKAGNPDEMLGAVTAEVMDTWRQGDSLQASFLPFNVSLRGRRPSGSKAILIPDIIPVARPATVRNFTNPATLNAGQSLADTLTSASTRAGDLAAQVNITVPTGPMHSIARAEARLPQMGVASRAINWFNQASTDPVQRVAAIAQRMTRGELSARLTPSRAQFLGRVREMFGSLDTLPERIEYIGPADRALHGTTVPANGHPLTGTILDFFENPGYYNDDLNKYLPEFLAYNERNTAVSELLTNEWGVKIGEFDTGITSAMTGGRGIFFPNADAGVGRVARGSSGPTVSPGSALRERKYPTMSDRLADKDQVLTDPVTDLGELFTRLDETKTRRAEIETYRYAVGGSRKPRTGWQEVAPLEMATGDKVWLPPEQATAAANWLTAKESGLANWFEDLKNTRLGGDMSPLTIQGAMGWALAPVDTARDVIEGLGKGMLQGNPLRPFTNEAMFQDIAAAPERWMRFFSYMGTSPAGGTPREWRSGFLENLPLIGGKLGDLNDGMTNALTRGMETTFNEMGTMLAQRGIPEDEAWAAASDVMRMGWLQQNFDQLGVGGLRRSVERGALTSTTFIRQPLALMAQAATGYAKLAASPARLFGTAGQWAELNPREVLAVHAFTKMAGTFTAISAISAAMSAEERGWTPEEALERNVLDVGGPDWMTLWLSKDVKLPLGGPYRALIRAIAPGPIEGVGEHIPFAGVGRFLTSRITTAGQLGIDFAQNEDFYGNAIMTEPGLRGLGQALAYAAANVVPVALGVPYQNARAGQPFSESVREIAFQYFGQNPMVASQYETLERERRIGARQLFNGGAQGRQAAGLTVEQAAINAPTLSQLRTAIGSRAANAATELANPNVAGARAAYIADLRRRADGGDREAEGLLVSIDTQEQLQGLASTMQVGGALDKTAYRNARGPLVDKMIGRSTAFQEVFTKMRRSESPVDRASTEWYDLFDKATTTVEVNGRQLPVGVDYDAFDKLESQFFAGMEPTLAALVQQNIAVSPLGGAPAEIELRTLRRDMAQAGFWRIDDELWQQMKPNLLKTNIVPPAALERAGNAETFTEYRGAIVAELTKDLVKQGFQPETAIQFAKSRFDARPEVGVFDSAMIERKADWASDHAEDGLAEKAIQWGYLSDSLRNLIEAGVAEGNEQRREAAKTEPAPRAQHVEPSLNARLAAEHDTGMSYGQLAIKYSLSRDAVISRIKRRLDTAPEQELLATFVRNEGGSIVGLERAPLTVVRDAEGRPIGIGKAT